MKPRTSPRRSQYDYSNPWWYFVTICTKVRQHYFGEIVDWILQSSLIGQICAQEIIDTNHRRNYVDIDEYIVMPNHIHLLLFINTIPAVGTCGNTSRMTESDLFPIQHCISSDTLPCVPTHDPTQTLWSIIRNIKSRVTKYAYENNIVFARQSRYHDRIIRNELEYNRVKHYIQTNPETWENDTFNQ